MAQGTFPWSCFPHTSFTFRFYHFPVTPVTRAVTLCSPGCPDPCLVRPEPSCSFWRSPLTLKQACIERAQSRSAHVQSTAVDGKEKQSPNLTTANSRDSCLQSSVVRQRELDTSQSEGEKRVRIAHLVKMIICLVWFLPKGCQRKGWGLFVEVSSSFSIQETCGRIQLCHATAEHLSNRLAYCLQPNAPPADGCSFARLSLHRQPLIDS